MTLVFCKSNRKHQDWFDDTDKKAAVYRFYPVSNGAMGRVETRPRGTPGTSLGVGHRANDHCP